MTDFSHWNWIFIFLGGTLSGFIDSIAGGGGLIGLPVLMAVGIPPLVAIGTNKVQSVFGTATASVRYTVGGLIHWRRIWPGVAASFIASIIGAMMVSRIDASALGRIIPFILLALWFYVALNKHLGQQENHARIRPGIYYPAAGCLFGFYDGFLGPGTGSFWTVSQVGLIGMDLKQSTASAKPSNFASNAGALLLFILTGQVLFKVGLVMALGQLIGAWTGAHLVVQRPPKFIYPFFLAVVAAIVLKLFWDQYRVLFN